MLCSSSSSIPTTKFVCSHCKGWVQYTAYFGFQLGVFENESLKERRSCKIGNRPLYYTSGKSYSIASWLTTRISVNFFLKGKISCKLREIFPLRKKFTDIGYPLKKFQTFLKCHIHFICQNLVLEIID